MSDDVDNETLSNASKALHEIGIEVYNLDGSYRKFDVIMGELANKWDDLTDAEKSNISFNIAATRQTNLLSSLLATFSDSMELATEAIETNGNAWENYEKYLDSYKGKLTALSTANKILWEDLLDSEALKNGVELLTKLVNLLDKLTNLSGGGVVFGGLTALLASNKIFSTGQLGLVKQYLKDPEKNSGSFASLPASFQSYYNNLDDTAKSANNATRNLIGYETQLTKTMAKTIGMRIATTALSMAIGAIVGLLISAVIKAFDNYIHRVENAAKKTQESSEEFQNATKEIKSLESELEEANSKIEEYNKLKAESGNLSLVNQDDLDKQKEIVKDLRETLALKEKERKMNAEDTLNNAGVFLNKKATYTRYHNNMGKESFDVVNGYIENKTVADALNETFDQYLNAVKYGLYEKNARNFDAIIDNENMQDYIEEFNTQYDSLKPLVDEGYISAEDENWKKIVSIREKYFKILYSRDKNKTNFLALSDENKREIIAENISQVEGISKNFAESVSEKLTDEQIELAYDITPISLINEERAKEQLQTEIDKLYDWLSEEGLSTSEISKIESKLLNGTFDSVFGNIDMNDREIITWTDEIKKKFEYALSSWNYNPENGGIDTVWGSSENFNGFEIAFSPILQTEDGPVFMDKDSVYDYIGKVIAQAEKLDGGATIENILKIDKAGVDGFKYGNAFVKGLIGGVTDESGNSSGAFNAIVTSDLMHFAGKFGAINLLPQATDSAESYISAWLKEANKELSKASLELPTPLETFEKAQSIGKDLDKLSAVYEDVKNKEEFDYSSIFDDDFKTAFGSFTEEYNAFVDAIMKSPDDIEKVQTAFNDLTTAYIRNSSALEDVTEDSKDATIAMLEQMGVENAETIVINAINNNLAQAKKLVKESTIDLTTATWDEIKAFIEAGNYSEELTEKIKLLIIQERISNGALDTSQGVKELQKLATQAGISIKALAELEALEVNISSHESAIRTGLSGVADKNAYMKEYQDLLEQKKNFDITSIVDEVNEQAKVSFYKNANFTGGSSTGKSSSSSSKTEETLDWIETKISRIEREITNLGKTVSATYKGWTERNSALVNEMSKVTDEISTQKAAYQAYMQAAEAVGLSEHYKQLVQSGGLSIETIKDETLKNQISKYKELYEKALACADAVQDLIDKTAELARQKFDNIAKQFEGLTSMIDHTVNMVDKAVSMFETKGHVVSKKFYEAMGEEQEQKLSDLTQKRAELVAAINEATASGAIEAGSEEWYSMREEINATEEAIMDATAALEEYKMKMLELEWEVFSKTQEWIGGITNESNFLIDVLDTEHKLLDDMGNFNEYGNSVLGLHAVNYDTYMAQAENYAEQIKQINKDLAEDPYSQTLIDKKKEFIEAQQQAIQSAEQEKESIKSLVEESYNALLEALQKIIDKRKEALDAEADLYEYEKNIREQTDKIAGLQKQLGAYGGDNSEETRATIQQLQTNLKEAEEELAETEYDRWKKDQEEMLDNFYDEVEAWLNSRLDDLNGILLDIIENTNNNSSQIRDTINSTAFAVGYQLSDSMEQIWNTTEDVVSAFNNSFDDYSVSTLQAVYTIEDYMQRMIAESDSSAAEIINAIRSAANDISTATGNAISSAMSAINSAVSAMNQSNNNKTTTTTTTTGDGKQQWYSLMVQNGEGTSYINYGSYKTEAAAREAAKKLPSYISDYKINKYHVGLDKGLVGSNSFTESDFDLIKELGDQEVPAILKKGEAVMTQKQMHSIATALRLSDVNPELYSKLTSFSVGTNSSNPFGSTSLANMIKGKAGGNAISNDISMNISLPNVTNTDQFINELQTNKRFEKVVQAMTIGNALGNNTLAKLKY